MTMVYGTFTDFAKGEWVLPSRRTPKARASSFDNWIQTEKAAQTFQLNGLTKREGEVLLWLLRGNTNGEIGRILHISSRTVSKHLENIYSKLGVESRTGALSMVIQIMEDICEIPRSLEERGHSKTASHHILVVENDSTVRRLLCELLEFHGYGCVGIDNGGAALTYLEKAQIDLVLTDYRIPDLGGIQFLECLSAFPASKQRPVIIHSGYMNQELVAKAYKAGAFAVLHKPCKVSTLLMVLEQAIDYAHSLKST